MYEYHADLVKVIDGDTVDLDVDLGMRVHTRARVRLVGVNAPEIYSVKKSSAEYKQGMRVKIFLINFLKGEKLILWTDKDRTGKYGRWLGTIGVLDREHPGVIRYVVNNAINKFLDEMENEKEND
jgi:micrococcal nuclease